MGTDGGLGASRGIRKFAPIFGMHPSRVVQPAFGLDRALGRKGNNKVGPTGTCGGAVAQGEWSVSLDDPDSGLYPIRYRYLSLNAIMV